MMNYLQDVACEELKVGSCPTFMQYSRLNLDMSHSVTLAKLFICFVRQLSILAIDNMLNHCNNIDL